MSTKRIAAICLAAFLFVGVLLIPGILLLTQEAGGTLSTDNMSISWDESGTISSVILQGKEMIVPSSSGFVITDANSGDQYDFNAPVSGIKKKKQSGDIADANLKMKVTYRQKGHAIYVEGTVTDTSKTDRLIRLEYMLPVSSENMYWYDDISTSNQIRTLGDYSRPVAYAINGHPMSLYPYGTISNGEQAVALGVPMELPQSFLIGYKSSGRVQAMTLQFDFALSPKTQKMESKADFSFVIYAPTEPEWGFRSASQDYYDLYPEYFEVKSNGGGNWLFQHSYAAVEGVEDFYFGYNETPTFGYYAIDKKYGVTSLEYTAPAEQWMEFPSMPKEPEPTYEQYMGRLNELINDTTGAMEPAFPDVTQKNAAEALKNSAILLENGKYHTMGWYAYGVTVGLVTNHNPDIPGWNSYKLQVSEIERAEAMAKTEDSRLGGVYIDNLAGISGLNYREDHFAYVDSPLLWNTNTKQLAIPGYSSMYSYTRGIRERCDENDQIIVANMVFPERGIAQYVHMIDVPGSECGPSWGWDPYIQRLRRTMAYRKPWMLLLGHDLGSADWGPSGGSYETKEAIMKSSIAYGLFANVIGYRVSTTEYEVTRPLFRKYTYIAVVQDKLGWNPITYATTSGTGYADCERFGDLGKGAAIFTMYNTGEKSAKFDGALNIDLNAMRLTEDRAKKLLAYDMVNNTLVPIAIKDGILTYDMKLNKQDLSAVMIGTKEEIFEWMFERIKGTLERGDEVADEINKDKPWGSMAVPKPWTELSNSLASVSAFKDKQAADALEDVAALVAGTNAVVAATDNAINVLFSYTNLLNIDVKNIYGDAYAILSGLFGADGNKDHSGLNKYEGAMQVIPEADLNNGPDSILIVCVALLVLVVAGGVVLVLRRIKKAKVAQQSE